MANDLSLPNQPATPSLEESIPGLHIVANLKSDQIALLSAYSEFRKFIETQISQFKLTQLGSVYYDFPTGGFTAVVCLSESHLSVHTWPESGLITFDIFLSNYRNDNRSTTERIYKEVCRFFAAEVVEEHFLNR